MSKKTTSKLQLEVRQFLGNCNPAAIAAFCSIVETVHRELEGQVFRRNMAIRESMESFGAKGIDYVRVLAELRAGVDPSTVKRLDEIAEFACRTYPDVFSIHRGEADTGEAEERFVRVLIEGIQPLPKAWDVEVLEAALQMAGGDSFLASFEVHEQPSKAVAKCDHLQSYREAIAKDILDIELKTPNRVSPLWRLNRLKMMIERLPDSERDAAIELSGYHDLVDMVTRAKGWDRDWAIARERLESTPF